MAHSMAAAERVDLDKEVRKYHLDLFQFLLVLEEVLLFLMELNPIVVAEQGLTRDLQVPEQESLEDLVVEWGADLLLVVRATHPQYLLHKDFPAALLVCRNLLQQVAQRRLAAPVEEVQEVQVVILAHQTPLMGNRVELQEV